MPALTLCPHYDSSYNEARLQVRNVPGVQPVLFQVRNVPGVQPMLFQEFGLTRDAYRREGEWRGNASLGERELFQTVAHSLAEVMENMEFLMVDQGKENKTSWSAEQVSLVAAIVPLQSSKKIFVQVVTLLAAREIRNPNYGRCFEVDLSKLNMTIESVSIVTLMPVYVYVNIPGQFHNGEYYSPSVQTYT